MCLFTASLEPSGLGEHMLALARELRSRFRVLLACSASPGGQSLVGRARGMDLETLMLDRQEADTADPLGRWLRSQGVQLFHDHAGIGWEGHPGIYAARRAGVAAIIRTEHLPYLLTDAAQREAHRRLVVSVDQLICVSEGARQEFMKAGLPAEKLRVVRNGISPPTPRASRLEVRQRLGLPTTARIVLTVARFEQQKGHLHLLAAIPAVRAVHPDTYFVWVGDGTLKSELREKLQAQGSDGFVRLVGSRSDVADLMGGSDVLVLPSLFEGLPLVILEAMSIGLPVVGTDVCGTAEAIEDGVSGRLVPPADPALLAASIVDVLDQPAQAIARAGVAQRRVREEFSATRMGCEVARVYTEVLSRITR